MDRWWAVDAEGRIATYHGTPQCNMHESIARDLILKNVGGAVDVEQIPAVFLPHRCEDYR